MSIDFSQVITAEAKAAAAQAAFIAAVQSAVDAHVEAVAKAKGYNGAAHLASYVASTVDAWAEEATTFVAWRDAVWLAVIGGMDSNPATVADVIDALPVIDWPE
jgi:hypothetical protein